MLLIMAVVALLAVVGLFWLGAAFTGGVLYFANYFLYVGFGIHMLPFYKDVLLGAVVQMLRTVLSSGSKA